MYTLEGGRGEEEGACIRCVSLWPRRDRVQRLSRRGGKPGRGVLINTGTWQGVRCARRRRKAKSRGVKAGVGGLGFRT